MPGPGTWAAAGIAATLAACGPKPPATQPPPTCRAAFEARDWPAVATACTGRGEAAWAALGRAWVAAQDMSLAEARSILQDYGRGEPAFDAVFLAGYVHVRSRDEAAIVQGRAWLWRAYFGFVMLGRNASAAYVAVYLSHAPRPEVRLADALQLAEIAVARATASGDPRARGAAETARAEALDHLGMADEARDGFTLADSLLAPWPDKLGYAYLKHGVFLDDLGDEASLRTALRYFGEAEVQLHRAVDVGVVSEATMRSVTLGIHLNRADTLAKLGTSDDLDQATAALEIAVNDEDEQQRIALVQAFIAARRGDLATAEARFAAAEVSDPDYAARFALELATSHRRAGRPVEAERAYREAIAAVERARLATGGVELRPWALAHRSAPYLGLLGLLAEQGRGEDALVVAESLHARAWLEAVVASPDQPGRTTDDALRDLRLRRQGVSEPALDRDAVFTRVGDREALVFTVGPDAIWRGHVRAGRVDYVRLSAADLAAVTELRRSPTDPMVAERAAAALLPVDLGAGNEPLVIVAGGELASLPFAALRRGGRYLIEDRPLVRVPGLAALQCRSGSWSGHRVFVGDARGNLPAAADEVRQLAGPDALIGQAATRAVVMGARDAALLHVAVHGLVTSAGGGLELADGTLTAAEVLESRLAPRLVVLTGCETAGSADAEAWGGFPSAFLAAGAGQVVATLRPVKDADAAAFAAQFYAQPDSVDPVIRTATAQRAMIAAGQPASAWSSFTVWGVGPCDVPAR